MTTRVLVVESDELLAENYRRFFCNEGFDVQTAGTADECVKHLLEFAPHVITLEPDVFASGPSSQLARNEMANVPIVVVSWRDLVAGVSANWRVARYFVKPVAMARIAKAIRNVRMGYAAIS